jgi:hypothetical protein
VPTQEFHEPSTQEIEQEAEADAAEEEGLDNNAVLATAWLYKDA